MNPKLITKRGLGITVRTALLSWMVTILASSVNSIPVARLTSWFPRRAQTVRKENCASR